jgi:ABC-type transport system substrate-binding protein
MLCVSALADSPLNMNMAKSIAGSLEGVPEKSRERTDSIVIAVPDLRGVTNPLWANTQGDSYMTSLMFDELVFFDEYGLPGNGLADVTVSEDGLTYTFLLKNARYSDLALVKSDDFINTIYILLMPGYDGSFDISRLPILGAEPYLAGTTDSILGLNRLDDNRFSVTLTRKLADALDLFAIPAMRVEHFGSAIRPIEIKEDETATRLWYEGRLREIKESEANLAAYGQYDLVSLEKGGRAVFAANQDYWRAKPSTGTFELLVVPVGEEYKAIAEGTVDIALCYPLVDEINELWQNGQGFVSMYSWLGDVTGYIGFNYGNPIFADFAVRQAIARGLNRAEIIKATLDSWARLPGMTLFDTFSKSADVLGELYPFSTESAAALLDEAGWASDGTTRAKNGVPLEFSIVIPQESPMATVIETELYKMADSLTIKLTVDKLPFEEWLARVTSGEADAYVAARRIPVSPALAANTFALDSQLNDEGFDSGSAERFINWANLETDRTRQSIVYEGLYQQLYLELSVIPIYRRFEYLMVNARVRNFYISTGHEITSDAYRMIVTTSLGVEQ